MPKYIIKALLAIAVSVTSFPLLIIARDYYRDWEVYGYQSSVDAYGTTMAFLGANIALSIITWVWASKSILTEDN